MSRAESQGKRLLPSAVAGSGSRTSCAAARARSGRRREDAPLGGDVVDLDLPEVGHAVLGGLAQIVAVVGGPGAGGDEVVVVLGGAQIVYSVRTVPASVSA